MILVKSVFGMLMKGRAGGAARRPGQRRFALNCALAALGAVALSAASIGPGFAGAVDKNGGGAGIYHVQPSEDKIDVQVTLHKSETVRVGMPFSEALVGNAEVADVVPLTDRAIYIVGKKVGVTRIALLDTSKQLLGVVDVEVTYDLDGLRARMHGNPAYEGVKIQSVGGKIWLSGVVPDAPSLQRVMMLAKQISPDEVTNTMSVAAPQQVVLEVRFIEAQRSAGRELGISGSVTGRGDVTGTTEPGGLLSGASPFGTIAASIIAGGTKISATIKALEERGLARRLAEPNLVALSGDTASFLAGGEFPFPVVGDNNQVSVQFKKFGVGLAFTPTVLADGQINLKIEPEVSELDNTAGVTIGTGGTQTKVPGLVVRRASTTVELRDGQSFAMAGLLQSNSTKDQSQLPWIGDVPVLGTLLRSASWQKNETDLVIIVTPRLVTPRAPGQKLATPLDKTASSNDAEFFLGGRQEIDTGKPDDFTGHIIDWKDEQPIGGSFKGAN